MLDKETERQVQDILANLSFFGELGNGIKSTEQTDQTFSEAVQAMAKTFCLNRAVLLTANSLSGKLDPIAAHQLKINALAPVRISSSLYHALIGELPLRSAQSFPKSFSDQLNRNLGYWISKKESGLVPLFNMGELVGLFVFERLQNHSSLSQHESDLLRGMCRNISICLYDRMVSKRLAEKQRKMENLYNKTREIYRQFAVAFLTAIDIKDGYTKEHSLRVARMSSVLAQELDFTEYEVESIYFTGLLHDIGKILVDKQVLTKRGSLDLTEYAEMSQHTRLGAEILSSIQFPWENLAYTIRHHHDRPADDDFSVSTQRHLALGTKIIGLVDAFDAMTSDRPYRRARTLKDSIDEIVDGLHDQFDPEITRIFFQILANDLQCPSHRRRILSDRLMKENPKDLLAVMKEALDRVEQHMGVITSY